MINSIRSSLFSLRKNKPLVLCLTNYVTMDLMANSLLALGAAPLMSESIEEIEELVSLSQAVYINLGTLHSTFMERAILAAKTANSLNKPLILDPVGAGASKLRTSAAMQLLPMANAVRGNASEIMSLAGAHGAATKGLESVHPVEKAMALGEQLSKTWNKIILISGEKDFLTDGLQTQILPFGSPLMSTITGMGCSLTAVLSAFVAERPTHPFEAALHATAYFGLCGQLAHQQAQVPGCFRQAFINNLFHPDWDYFAKAIHSHAAEESSHAL